MSVSIELFHTLFSLDWFNNLTVCNVIKHIDQYIIVTEVLVSFEALKFVVIFQINFPNENIFYIEAKCFHLFVKVFFVKFRFHLRIIRNTFHHIIKVYLVLKLYINLVLYLSLDDKNPLFVLKVEVVINFEFGKLARTFIRTLFFTFMILTAVKMAIILIIIR